MFAVCLGQQLGRLEHLIDLIEKSIEVGIDLDTEDFLGRLDVGVYVVRQDNEDVCTGQQVMRNIAHARSD